MLGSFVTWKCAPPTSGRYVEVYNGTCFICETCFVCHILLHHIMYLLRSMHCTHDYITWVIASHISVHHINHCITSIIASHKSLHHINKMHMYAYFCFTIIDELHKWLHHVNQNITYIIASHISFASYKWLHYINHCIA